MWKNININKNQIQADTGKAMLINCPHNSNYDGYSFWHPAKLIRAGRHSASLSLGYTEEFEFRLIKYGKGKYNSRDIISEEKITAEEFEEMYGVENENIVAPKIENPYETHKPEEVKAVEDNLKEELKDD